MINNLKKAIWYFTKDLKPISKYCPVIEIFQDNELINL